MTRMYDFVLRHTIGIYRHDVDENLGRAIGRPEFIGSGVLIEHNGNHYLASAGHILKDVADPNAHYGVFTCDKEFLEPGEAKFVNPTSGYRDDDMIDVGVWRIPSEFVQDIEKSHAFLSSSLILRNHREIPHYNYLCVGYPATKIDVDSKRRVVVESPFKLCTRGVSDTAEGKNAIHNPDYNYLLEFHRDKFRNADGARYIAPIPKGISGGGVWYFDKDARPRLAGILIEWKMPEERLPMLMATRIDFVMEIIFEMEAEIGEG